MSEQVEGRKGGRRFGCLGVALLVFGLMTLAVVTLVVWFATTAGGCTIGHGRAHRTGARLAAGEDDAPSLGEVWSSGSGDTKVVRIPLTGLIFLGEDGGWLGESAGAAATALRAIKRATYDPDVEGILLEIDSGGGGITASDIIYQALLDFKKAQKGRVVVALMGDIAASGAYYIALAADRIVAHPTTLTGSIGVIMQTYNLQELARKVGVKDVTIKSGENKDLLNPFQEVKTNQLAMIQGVIDAMHSRFVRLVASSRKLPEEEVRRLADGRVFVADDAVTNKLIDAIGYRADAEETMADLLNAEGLHVVRYEEQVSFFDLLRHRPGFGMRLKLSDLLGAEETRLMYRWSL